MLRLSSMTACRLWRRGFSNRGSRYKLVHFAKLPPLLFDLQEDPDEFNNLAEDPAYRAVLLEETQKMLSWRISQDERTLTNLRLTADGIRTVG